jgi:hypothetical protein
VLLTISVSAGRRAPSRCTTRRATAPRRRRRTTPRCPGP